jgi:hypothetical protein
MWLFLLSGALLVCNLCAQQEDGTSCCLDALSTRVQRLPETASDKERWLWRLHEECLADENDIYRSPRYVEALRARLQALPPDASAPERFGARWLLAQACLGQGHLEEAIGVAEECLRLAEANRPQAAGWVPQAMLLLAVIHFRMAEKENCIARHNAESCILPLSSRAAHVDQRGAEAARAILVRLLEVQPDETGGVDVRLEAAWMLNIVAMALRTWPEGVPDHWRLPPSRFAAEASLPRFIDRAREMGLARLGRAGSVAIDDFTGDGRLDLLACSFDTDQPLRLCRNDGDGIFTDVTSQAGLSLQLGGSHLVQGDIDNDGLLDVLVVRGGGYVTGRAFPISLLRQDKPGHFIDITADAGIEVSVASRAAAMADIDRDGDLDVFLGDEAEPVASSLPPAGHYLFRNDGQAKFTNASTTSGIDRAGQCTGATFGDIDGDGDPDLFVTLWQAGNRLYVNRGDGTFSEQSAARGLFGPLSSGPAVFFDHDNDGDADLLVTSRHVHEQLRAVAAFYLQGSVRDDRACLFENDGRGYFLDVARARGFRHVLAASGLNVGDVDNDGCLDVYVATGGHDMAALFPNVLLLGGSRFRDATFAAGVGHVQKGNGVAFGDLDDDGDLDLACQVGGWHRDDRFGDVLFQNPGAGGRWLAIDLRGTEDNRFGIGARLRMRVVDQHSHRDLYRTVGSGGTLGCNPLRVHFGLGLAERAEFLEVEWPAAGSRQRVEDLPMDTTITVRQDQSGWQHGRRSASRHNG